MGRGRAQDHDIGEPQHTEAELGAARLFNEGIMRGPGPGRARLWSEFLPLEPFPPEAGVTHRGHNDDGLAPQVLGTDRDPLPGDHS